MNWPRFRLTFGRKSTATRNSAPTCSECEPASSQRLFAVVQGWEEMTQLQPTGWSCVFDVTTEVSLSQDGSTLVVRRPAVPANAVAARCVFVPIAVSVAGGAVPSAAVRRRLHSVSPLAGVPFLVVRPASGGPSPAARPVFPAAAGISGPVGRSRCSEPEDGHAVAGLSHRLEQKGEAHCSRHDSGLLLLWPVPLRGH